MIVVFASGRGSHFQALTKAFPNESFLLVCNEPQAPVLVKAQEQNIPIILEPHRNHSQRQDHETAILKQLTLFPQIKLIVLAGYMRILSPAFFALKQAIPQLASTPILNIHPADLHDYKGAHAFEYAVAHKFPRWGLSVHYVTEELDNGELIFCKEIPLFPYESHDIFKQRVLPQEHQLLRQSIEHILSQKGHTP
jgi:phosphoribosylglycinamide formyltransferase-1